MADYYVEDRDVSIECTVVYKNGAYEMELVGLGTFYEDSDCNEAITDPILTPADQVYDMESYTPLTSHDLTISTTSTSGWSYAFQTHDGSNWSSDLNPPLTIPTTGNTHWRIHANDGENDAYSDPFMRIASGCHRLPQDSSISISRSS